VRVLAICGSLQKESGNLRLLELALELAPAEVELQLFDGIRALPHFDPDNDGTEPPASVTVWRRALRESQAVLIATPEYGHSLPGALKNALDWVIGSGELYQKPVALTAAVPSLERGRRGLDALKNVLLAVDARVVSSAPIVRGAGLEQELLALLLALIDSARGSPPA